MDTWEEQALVILEFLGAPILGGLIAPRRPGNHYCGCGARSGSAWASTPSPAALPPTGSSATRAGARGHGGRLGHQLHLGPRPGPGPAGAAAVPRRPPADPPLAAPGLCGPAPGGRAAAGGRGQPRAAAAVRLPRQPARRHRRAAGRAGRRLRLGPLPAVPGHPAGRRPGPGPAVPPRPGRRAPAAQMVRRRRAGPGRGAGRRHHRPVRVRLQPAARAAQHLALYVAIGIAILRHRLYDTTGC
jgi:hypothetical protein